MYIKSIKVHKYRRFPLYENDTLEIDFEHKVTMVSGRNGSGKSSLFSLLTPLPADKNDFYPGGYVTLNITNNGNDYVVTSDFSNKSPSFKFIFNGDELNEAGIVSTQRILVQQHFNITQNLFDIMYGKEIFTDMTFAGRKKLFSTLTKLNIDHVLKGYSKLNEQLNLHKLMLKNEQKQYKSEEAKLMDEGEFKKLSESLKEINTNIDYLLDMRSNLSRFFNPESSESSMLDLQELLLERNKIIKDNYTLLTTHPKGFLEKRRDDLNEKFIGNKNKLQFLYRDLEELQSMERSMIENKLTDKETLEKKVSDLKDAIENIKGLLSYVHPDEINNPNLDNLFYSIDERIKDYIKELPTNRQEDGTLLYTSEKLKSHLAQKEELTNKFSALTLEERNLVESSETAKTLPLDLKCPGCDKTWHLHEAVDQDKINQKLSKIREEKNKLKVVYDKVVEYINLCEHYFSTYKAINQARKESEGRGFGLFWKAVSDEDILLSSPQSITNMLQILKGDVTMVNNACAMTNGIAVVEERIRLLKSFNGDSLSGIQNKIKQLNEDIINIIIDNSEYSKLISNIDRASVVLQSLEALDRSVGMTKDNVREYNLSIITSKIFNIIDNEVRELRVRSSELDGIVHGQDNINYTLKNISDKIVDIEETIHVLDITLKELSPKNGIIAKTISSFLNTIIHNVNKTLHRIWSYKMELAPIDLEHSDLNYKFRIIVEDNHKVDDISLASKGMKEAINLAFKLVIYKLYNFDNYPLYLDELASNMDEEHTSKMSQLVHSFAYESNFSQLFIISHKENMGFLKDVDSITLG